MSQSVKLTTLNKLAVQSMDRKPRWAVGAEVWDERTRDGCGGTVSLAQGKQGATDRQWQADSKWTATHSQSAVDETAINDETL